MSKHTPTPWTTFTDTRPSAGPGGCIRIEQVGTEYCVGIVPRSANNWHDEQPKADADHIVKCVNAHDALREALGAMLERYDADRWPREIEIQQARQALALSAKEE
jgi:hypothetical protein